MSDLGFDPDEFRASVLRAVAAAGLEARGFPTSGQAMAPPDPRKAPPVAASDQQLAVSRLQYEGASESDALRTVFASPPETVKALADKERPRLQERADQQAAAEYARSPEGLREQAATIRAAQEAEAQLAADARVLLGAQGVPIEGASDAEVIDAAGLGEAATIRAEQEAEANSLEANLAALSKAENARTGSGEQS